MRAERWTRQREGQKKVFQADGPLHAKAQGGRGYGLFKKLKVSMVLPNKDRETGELFNDAKYNSMRLSS